MKKLKRIIKEALKNSYDVVYADKLIYKVIVNPELRYEPFDSANPMRGDYAFQTDLMIKKTENGKEIPLVVIETKYKSLTTHDVILYSAKAQKHKEIYPHLRYGLIIGGMDKIVRRFFVHNNGFDFAYALRNFNKEDLNELSKIIEQQIDNAEGILKVFMKKNSQKKKVKSFNTIIQLH
ncbi:MAG: hypothetical protein N2043_09160 [Ignavibacterium sp.]|nr:hypothetical protein [Ignavibacterium sp.]